MGKISFSGLDTYMAKLSALEKATDEIIESTVSAGASVAADAMRAAIERLPTSEHNGKPWFGTPGHPARGPSEAQKQGLLDSLGITPVGDDGKGFINAKVGFDGYNSVRSKQWPNGEPNLLIARAVNSGTSFMAKNAFAKDARAKSSRKARQTMEKTAEREIEKAMK